MLLALGGPLGRPSAIRADAVTRLQRQGEEPLRGEAVGRRHGECGPWEWARLRAVAAGRAPRGSGGVPEPSNAPRPPPPVAIVLPGNCPAKPGYLQQKWLFPNRAIYIWKCTHSSLIDKAAQLQCNRLQLSVMTK